MTTIDIILAVFLLYFAYKGYSSGFIISVATLAGMVLGLYAAAHFSEFTAAWLQKDLGLKSGNIKLMAYIITFVIVMVLTFLIGRFLTTVVKTAGLGIVNRLGGVALRLIEGALIASFVFMLFARIDPKEKLFTAEQKQASVLYKPISAVAPLLIPMLQKYYDKVKEKIAE